MIKYLAIPILLFIHVPDSAKVVQKTMQFEQKKVKNDYKTLKFEMNKQVKKLEPVKDTTKTKIQ